MYNMVPIVIILNCILENCQESKSEKFSSQEKKFCHYVWWRVGEGNGNPLQYSCLENPMDGGAWRAAVHGVAEGQTRLSNFTFAFHFPALEKEMATDSSVLAWRIPRMVEPGGLPSLGSHRVGHDWSDLAAAAWWQVLSRLIVVTISQLIEIPYHYAVYLKLT